MLLEARDILIRPLITESSTALMEENKYVFVVHKDANKIQIAQAVTEIFKVKVVSVNTINVKGKVKTRNTRMGKVTGRRPNYKKAIVKVAAGETIQFFE